MKGYRTIVVNALMFLVAMLGYFGADNLPDLGAINTFVDHLDAIVLFAAPFVNMGLRLITSTSVGSKT